MNFQLHPQLEKDLIYLGDLDLSKVFLLPDSDNPWVVLVPKVAHIKEFYELNETQQIKLAGEINKISKVLQSLYQPDKLNIGMLGNMVPQLHTHIICRYKTDRAWPGSIWGSEACKDSLKIDEFKKQIMEHLELC